jgi:hypothetical protein
MAKSSGLGDALLVGAVDLSGDVGSLEKIASPVTLLDVTGIDKGAVERIGGKRDGAIDFTAFFNTAVAAAHLTLSPLPTTGVTITYLRGVGTGKPSATLVAKQVNYDGTRGADGSFTFKVSAVSSDGSGLVWGVQL